VVANVDAITQNLSNWLWFLDELTVGLAMLPLSANYSSIQMTYNPSRTPFYFSNILTK
jgi:hypothetical protein